MISYTAGDILSANADALVNTVNCVGIMGRGIALQFKNAFPENFKAYAAACAREEVHPGKMFIFETGQIGPKYIINFPTKRHWRGKSRIEDIVSGLSALADDIQRLGIRSIAIPPLGAGLGGLHWPDVRALIQESFERLPEVETQVFEPAGTPDAKVMARVRDVPSMTPGRAALVVLMHRYLSGLLDPFITLLEVHKLMYFMQERGQPLKLEYVKHINGPYAQNLRHVLKAIEGHLVSGYKDGGDDPRKKLELVPGAVVEANRFLAEDQLVQARFQKVAELVEGFETPFGMELLATVHWVMTRETTSDVVEQVYRWNDNKRHFTPRQIAIAADVLQRQGWLKAA